MAMILSIDDQVPTLEQCLKLKELGFPQDTLIAMVEEKDGDGNPDWVTTANDDYVRFAKDAGWQVVAAPTVAEMGAILPDGYATAHNKYTGLWSVWQLIGNMVCMEQQCPTEAQARAASLINLAEVNYSFFSSLKTAI